MREYTEEQLKEIIEKEYGFNRKLIKKPVLLGLWHVRFMVNGIKYYGHTPFYGALPQLKVEGYDTDYFDHETPVTESYYERNIKGHKVRILHAVDPKNGNWEDTGMRCEDQETAKYYIAGLEHPEQYYYDFEF